MWQRFTRSLKTAFKGRFVGPRQPPGQIRTLLSYPSSPTTVHHASASFQHWGQSIFRPYSSSPFRLSYNRFHSPSKSLQLRLPRPPHIPGRVTDVGLGVARNFSTARPIFQHLVENVPVAGRALYEFELNVDKRLNVGYEAFRFTKEEEIKKMPSMTSSVFQHQPYSAPFLGITNCHTTSKTTLPEPGTSEGQDRDQLDSYFTSPSPCFSVVTFLQIPLTPMPSPSPACAEAHDDGVLNSADALTFLDFSYVASERALYSTHAAKVSSLYDRLNANQLWEHDVSCEALYDDSSGLCFALRVKFEGWIEDDVQSILNLTADDLQWCTLWQEESFESSDHQPFIMPTVDFSSGWEPGELSNAWENCLSSEEKFKNEFALINYQPEMEEWFLDNDAESLDDSTSDLSNFGTGSVVLVP